VVPYPSTRARSRGDARFNGSVLELPDAGVEIPADATDELQIMPKKRWWQRLRAS
jgi:hypothetical protein